jgi:hypothetical protein
MEQQNNNNNENITPDLEKIKILIGKVAELANRGIGGEKDAAKKKLEKLLKKYGLKLSDIDVDGDDKQQRTIRIKNREDYLTILTQVIWDVVVDIRIQQNTKKLEIYVKLTTEQYIEVKEKFDYFWNLWCKEKEQFLMAFVIKNRLGLVSNKRSDEAKQMDDETRNGIRDKMLTVARGKYLSKNTKLISEK